ncbi:uncharacterized protein LOC115276914 [Suricata suricatta]|uniref:uncharacterized protein LOC115276914 n=1 Tax=Suricata suricatta TaxID=37032 RepID=UPI0011557AEA|nr:uncharacterized protein LOC115276914 [Suricata suricatta]
MPGKSGCPWGLRGGVCLALLTVNYVVMLQEAEPLPHRKAGDALWARGRHVTGAASLCPSRIPRRSFGFVGSRESPASTEAALCRACVSVLHSPHPAERWHRPVYSRNLGSVISAVKEVQVQSLMTTHRPVCPEWRPDGPTPHRSRSVGPTAAAPASRAARPVIQQAHSLPSTSIPGSEQGICRKLRAPHQLLQSLLAFLPLSCGVPGRRFHLLPPRRPPSGASRPLRRLVVPACS